MSTIALFTYYSIVGTSGMLVNALLLHLALFHSPPQIKTYRILIINFAVTDMASSFFIMIIVPRIIPVDLSMIHIFYGLCNYSGKFVCYAAYSMTLHLFMHSMWSLLFSFAYRYYILVHGAPSMIKLVGCLALIYIPCFIQFIVFMFTSGDPNALMEILKSKFPNYNVDISTVTGITDVLSPAVTYTIINMTVPIFPIYIGILIFRKRILHKLEANAAHLRSETRSIHRQLLKALTLQAGQPSLFMCGAVIFICLEVKIISQYPVLECLIFAIPAPIPLLSGIISIYHIRPYRQALMRVSRLNIAPKEHHSSAAVLTPQVKPPSLSRLGLHRLSVPT